ncbi:DUF6415 family natural product biosynthesis protein [Streptomyces sp. NRRL F-525]|uniref:DUF6415 family natural product biosynthesis protein n=1 Tax=Streptomyces sp. NRRL F-525 TaxID=1463861 RepID=UPI0005277F73|nr:DUF6415 family natural product biosynthesis protein [Streptomyces sp. NRRL F-525]
MRPTNAHPPTAEDRNRLPPDIEMMRVTADRLLDPDATPGVLPLSAAELDILIQLMRGQLELLIPDIQRVTGEHPKNVAHYCALACVGEARERLRLEPGSGWDRVVAYGRRLARVLNALCDHYENIGVRS